MTGEDAGLNKRRHSDLGRVMASTTLRSPPGPAKWDARRWLITGADDAAPVISKNHGLFAVFIIQPRQAGIVGGGKQAGTHVVD